MYSWLKKYEIMNIRINKINHPEWCGYSINKHNGWVYFHLGRVSLVIKQNQT